MSSATPLPITDEEYLFLDRRAEFKNELIDGVVVAMAGGRRAHLLISMNLSRIISTQLLDKPCEACANELRVRAEKPRNYFYPDLVIVCDNPQFVDNEFDTLTNPNVVIEILSPSTEKMDRGPKFHAYLKMPSLQAYILIAQDEYSIDLYTRQPHDWLYQNYNRPDDVVEIPSVGVRLTLSDIYAKVVFPPEPNPDDASANG